MVALPPNGLAEKGVARSGTAITPLSISNIASPSVIVSVVKCSTDKPRVLSGGAREAPVNEFPFHISGVSGMLKSPISLITAVYDPWSSGASKTTLLSWYDSSLWISEAEEVDASSASVLGICMAGWRVLYRVLTCDASCEAPLTTLRFAGAIDL